MSSGEDIEAGRVTTAESTTVLLAAVPSERDVDFNGFVILTVAPQPGQLKSNITLDGIHAVGNNGSVGAVASPGGSGVVGFGGPNQGSGVVGLGGGVNGLGGFGVHGIGGSQSGPSFHPNDPPGTGVVAQGGRMGNDDDKRFLHGAGVVALAGGAHKPLPILSDTGSIGVYAQGAEAEVRTVNIDTVDTVVGPLFPASRATHPFRPSPRPATRASMVVARSAFSGRALSPACMDAASKAEVWLAKPTWTWASTAWPTRTRGVTARSSPAFSAGVAGPAKPAHEICGSRCGESDRTPG